MSKGREVRGFNYVNHPYEAVRDALNQDAASVFQTATKVASTRAQSVASALHINIAGIEVGTDVTISVGSVEEGVSAVRASPVTRLRLEWQATRSPGLFPLMKAELSVYPLTSTETQLDFSGRYEPPLGWLGSAVDAVVGHRIAEATVQRFVDEVAGHLRGALARATSG